MCATSKQCNLMPCSGEIATEKAANSPGSNDTYTHRLEISYTPTVSTITGLLSQGDPPAVALMTIDGASLDYQVLRETVAGIADQLSVVGVVPGDRIALVMPNGPEMALLFLAVASVACAAPLNPKYKEPEFRFYLDDLGAKVLIVPDGGHDDAERAAGGDVTTMMARGSLESLELITAATPTPDVFAAEPDPEDVALVLHTSGTTSRPKIVPLKQKNLVGSARNVADSLRLTSADRSLNVMPLFHIHGLVAGLLAPLSAGGSVVCTPGFDAFRYHGWLDSLTPTYVSAVPTIHQMVLARTPEPRPTNLRFIRSSSSALRTTVLDALEGLFDVPVIEAYGMTEATHQMASNPLPPQPAKAGSVGLSTGIEIAVINGDGSQLGTGERGEVAVRGATIVDGYENNADANASAFTTDGWFRTGDQGYLDEDGYLFLTGRIKEQINRGGEKIAPLEVDDVLLSHPDVEQAVACAVPDPVLGEDIAAAVVLRAGGDSTPEDIRRHAAAHLAAFKVPRRVLVVEEIPKGPTGKIQRIGLAKALGIE